MKVICIGNKDPYKPHGGANTLNNLSIGKEYELFEYMSMCNKMFSVHKIGSIEEDRLTGRNLLTWITKEDCHKHFISIQEYRNEKIENIFK